MTGPRVVIGVTAHNEERNLGRLLARLRDLELPDHELLRIVVVASGCTDGTVGVARKAAEADPRLVVIVDPERRGKAVAINQFISTSPDAELLVMESADTLPEPGAIGSLLAPFGDPDVGMVGGHPMPEDDDGRFVGHLTQLLWRLHHEVATRSPKQGELIAWRNVVPAIPITAVDEAFLEAAVTRAGLRLAYAPAAVVRNRGPATLPAFIEQRRRIHAGHRVLAATEGYRPATRDKRRLLALAAREAARRPGRLHWTAAAALIEAWAALLGWWDHRVAGRDHSVWTVIGGTKALSAPAPAGTVGAVIVSYDDRELTLRCLAMLERGTRVPERITVIDNGGSDGTAVAVAARHPRVEVVRLTVNGGLACAFNEGARRSLAAGCEFVLQVSPDVELAADFLDTALAAASREPRVATVGGPVFYADQPERLWYAGGEIAWWLGKTYHRGRRVVWGPAFALERSVAYANGSAVLFRSDALRDVGEWDEGYFLVFEESDWCVRAARRGWRHLYVPGARAWHRVSSSFGGEKSAIYLYFLFRNNVRFMRRLARPWHWPTFLIFYLGESLLRYALTSLLLPDRGTRLLAILLAALDAARGTTGAGSVSRLTARRQSAAPGPAPSVR